MHMPGHKRNASFSMMNPYLLDFTEVEGTDNLHHPEGMIRHFMDMISQKYGTRQSRLLTGGSTCGILAAVSACCEKGSVLLMDRGCHRSVYHAVCLLGLKPRYIMPETDETTGISTGIRAEDVEKFISAEKEKISAVVITSPTYEGVVSDVKKIAGLVHEVGIPLIVDEAHGAHFEWAHGIVQGMPQSAVRLGADLVIQSMHKTLPALTQTALLHIVSDRVPADRVDRWLAVYETSSPSYVLMASAGECLDYLQKKGKKAYEEYGRRLLAFYDESEKWKHLRLWEHPHKEPSKLVIYTGDSGLTGPELAEKLRKGYRIETELAASCYVLAMTSVADTGEGFLRLAQALIEIDGACAGKKGQNGQVGMLRPVVARDAYEAANAPFRSMEREEALGYISTEYAMIYPPGIPFLVPGEVITREVLSVFEQAEKKGLCVLGPAEEGSGRIRVVWETKEETEWADFL